MNIVLETGQASVSMLERKTGWSYKRASHAMDELEKMGVVGPFMGTTPREINAAYLATKKELARVEIYRKSKFIGCAVHYSVWIGSTLCGVLKNGGVVCSSVRPGPYNLRFEANGKVCTQTPIFVSDDTALITICVSMGNLLTSKVKMLSISEQKKIKPSDDISLPRDEAPVPEITPAAKKETTAPIPAAKLTVKEEAITPIPEVAPAAKKEIIIPKPVPLKDRNPLELIRLMEKRFEERYQFAYTHFLNAHDCKRMYEKVVSEFSCLELPLAVQVRFEQLCSEYKEKFSVTNPFVLIDAMNGYDFECWCANLLKQIGFTNVEVTKDSGDQGVDILAVKDGIKYAIQCKCYSSNLGNKPVQEINTGKAIYRCQIGAVITNRYFTAGGRAAAEATGVLLWDRDWIQRQLDSIA